MSADAWAALIGSAVVGLVVRLSNVLVAWLARVLGVSPPEPIPVPGEELLSGGPRPGASEPESEP